MSLRSVRFLEILIIPLLISGILRAQASGAATLSGTVTNPSGTAVPNAKVSARNLATGQSAEAQTDVAGRYSVSNLTPGEYEVSTSADGFAANTSRVTVAAGAKQTLDLALTAGSGNSTSPSLGDLGFTPDQTKGSAQDHDSEQDPAISHGAAFLTTNKKKGRQIPEAFMDS